MNTTQIIHDTRNGDDGPAPWLAALAWLAVSILFFAAIIPVAMHREAHRQDVVRAMTCQQYPHKGCEK